MEKSEWAKLCVCVGGVVGEDQGEGGIGVLENIKSPFLLYRSGNELEKGRMVRKGKDVLLDGVRS